MYTSMQNNWEGQCLRFLHQDFSTEAPPGLHTHVSLTCRKRQVRWMMSEPVLYTTCLKEPPPYIHTWRRVDWINTESALQNKPTHPSPLLLHRIRLDYNYTRVYLYYIFCKKKQPWKTQMAVAIFPMLHHGVITKHKLSKKTPKATEREIFNPTFCTGLLYCFPESSMEKAHSFPSQDKSIWHKRFYIYICIYVCVYEGLV